MSLAPKTVLMISFSFFLPLFFFLSLFRAAPAAYGVPRLEIKSELQLSAHTTAAAAPDPLTHWARQGAEPVPPQQPKPSQLDL